jgi:hypothetical protein
MSGVDQIQRSPMAIGFGMLIRVGIGLACLFALGAPSLLVLAGPLAKPLAQPHYALSALLCLWMAGLMTVFVIMAHGSRRHRMQAGYDWMSD